MSFWMGLSGSSCNPSLAWSMGNGGKGRIVIKFPFTLQSGWYREQACTKFRVFQHRKERKGFRHEFIVLRLLDGSVCRVERMGDPNARFDALSPGGSIAYDLAQCFRPEDMDQACLESSELISEITLPCNFDIKDVLKVCRAIHEGEKTRNYTLQIYNCWFFSLAIQVCLSRLIAHWEDEELLGVWLSQVGKVVELLTYSDQSPASPPPTLHRQIFSRIYSTLRPCNDNHKESFIGDVKTHLQSRIHARSMIIQRELTYRVNNILWYHTISSSLNEFIKEEINNAMMDVLRKRFSIASSPKYESQQPLEALKLQTLSTLTALLDLASHSTDGGKLRFPRLKHTSIKRKLVCQVAVKPLRGPETPAIESKYNGIPPTRATENIAADWYSKAMCYLPHLVHLVWCLLHAVLSIYGIDLSPRVDMTPCIIVDHELEYITARLERLDSIKSSDLEEAINEIVLLIRNPAATWDKSPWANIYEFIMRRMPGNMLKDMELHKPKLEFQSSERSGLDTISGFQRHILRRIEGHAKEVERNWLGSSASIQIELEHTLSQVWERIREDKSITEKIKKPQHKPDTNVDEVEHIKNQAKPEFEPHGGDVQVEESEIPICQVQRQGTLDSIQQFMEGLFTRWYPQGQPEGPNIKAYNQQSYDRDQQNPPYRQSSRTPLTPGARILPVNEVLLEAPRPGRKRALCIGINYIGQVSQLHGCINDVHKIADFLTAQFGYRPQNIRKLTDDATDPNDVPTRENIVAGMHWLVEGAQATDSLFFHFSGHGGQTKDTDGDEEDALDEVIYPLDFEYKGHIVDDEMHEIMVQPLRAGCRLTVLFDCSHSGTTLDLPYTYSTDGSLKDPIQHIDSGAGLLHTIKGLGNAINSPTRRRARKQAILRSRELRSNEANVISLSACKDSEEFGDPFGGHEAVGILSHAFIQAVKQKPEQSYRELLIRIREILRPNYKQKPQLSSSHPIDTNGSFIA